MLKLIHTFQELLEFQVQAFSLQAIQQIEFLILGLDPYPRKPGAVFQQPQDVKPDPSPFAALAGLKDRDGR